MRRLSVVMVLVVLLALSTTVSAEGLKLVSGIGYTTFEEYRDSEGEDGLSTPFGFYVGVTKKVSERLGITGQYEQYKCVPMTPGNGEVELDEWLQLQGVVGIASFDITKFLSVNAGIGWYRLGSYFEYVEYSTVFGTWLKTTMGYKGGLSLKHAIRNDLNVRLDINYRKLMFKGESFEVDVSGPELGAAVVYYF